MLAAWSAFRALPRFAQQAAWAALAVLTLLTWLHFHDRAVIREHEAKIAAQVEEITRLADEAALARAALTKKRIEESNDRAREAARGSDDPWRDGLGALK